ncbi:MAG: hypothetical protein EOP64_00350 [Sphingomonas sp.]|nr:MAG: hypothetical protein EOP64_00350 [Sphingomonas sp.]
MTNRPSSYLAWVPDGDPLKQQKPPAAQSNAGFTKGEPIPFQFLNGMFRVLDQWVQALDQSAALSQTAAAVLVDSRLVNTGTWSWDAGTGVVSWSQAFQIAVPGLPDNANQIAAGSATVTDGQVIAANLNLPLTIVGTLSSGSNQLSSLATTQGIAAGQLINAPGVPSGTSVQSLSGSTVTMTANATASASAQSVIFYSSGAPGVQIVADASLVPGPNTVVLARRVGNLLLVGLNTALIAMRDQETRQLHNGGYGYIASYTAGQVLTDRQAVFMALANDGSLTAGSIYPADASAANAAKRSQLLGFVLRGGAVGSTLSVVSTGVMSGFAGLTPGATYYLDPANVGAITATRPAGVGQPAVPAGYALSATTLQLTNPALSGLDRADNKALSGNLTAAGLGSSAASAILTLLEGTSLAPAKANAQDVGNAAAPFRSLFAQAMMTTRLIARDNAVGIATGPLVPDQSGYALGTPAAPYSDGYISRVHAPAGLYTTYPLTTSNTVNAAAVAAPASFSYGITGVNATGGTAASMSMTHVALNAGSLASLAGYVTISSTAAFNFTIQMTTQASKTTSTSGATTTQTVYTGSVAANAGISWFAVTFTEAQFTWLALSGVTFSLVTATAIPANTRLASNVTFNLTS